MGLHIQLAAEQQHRGDLGYGIAVVPLFCDSNLSFCSRSCWVSSPTVTLKSAHAHLEQALVAHKGWMSFPPHSGHIPVALPLSFEPCCSCCFSSHAVALAVESLNTWVAVTLSSALAAANERVVTDGLALDHDRHPLLE